LEQFGRVEAVVLDEQDGTYRHVQTTRETSGVACQLPVNWQRRHSVGQKLNWVLNPRSRWPHGIAADYRSLQRLWQLRSGFDLIWFFKLRSANVFPCWNWPSSVVDIDDVPSTFEESVRRRAQSVQERIATSVRVWSWRRREKLLDERFTVLTVCSESDKEYLTNLGLRRSIHVVANGFDRPGVLPARNLSRPPRIGFMGIFDHGPNLEGIRWFVKQCWPLIKMQVPEARLRLVGRLSDGPLKPDGTDIDALGWVADPSSEMATWSSMVVPVHVGAGTRGKIAHAFSQKCPVVSTYLGAFGYDARDGVDMFLADSAEAFADACVRTVRQPGLAAAVAERAWHRFLETWTWDAIRPHVWAAAEDCLRMQSTR